MVRAEESPAMYRWCFGVDHSDYAKGKIPDAVLIVFWNSRHGHKLLIRDLNHFHNRLYEIEQIWREETCTPVRLGEVYTPVIERKKMIRVKRKPLKVTEDELCDIYQRVKGKKKRKKRKKKISLHVKKPRKTKYRRLLMMKSTSPLYS